MERDIPPPRRTPSLRALPWCLLLAAGLAGCVAPPGESPPSPAPLSTCPIDELAFTQATGCLNDGSVEFCLPSGDEALVARVREIAPTIKAGSSAGRAGCDLPEETLYFFPTGDAECVAHHGALVDAAWEKLCRIATLPEVRAIVPTWYE
ncbi:hypothetical protein [Polyangium spumosum]|uniref:hypothetical protein n=1 Tax=Polyangium spumosum TaxID=889282 RepID=UPI001F0FADE1|nr:hypothetical protein [Polyangium spumosum]